VSIRPEAIKEHGDLWESKALDMHTEWVSLGCRGDNDMSHDEKDYDFTEEDLKLIELGREEMIRRGLHRYTYDQVTLYVLNGRISQDDADLYIDVWMANPVHMTPKWYDRVSGLNGLRERFNE
jgi:hypothetical protein